MIVQAATTGAPLDGPRFVIAQREHARVAGQLASAWGNPAVASLSPRRLLEQLVLEHDRGWDAVDPELERDPATGLPWNLVSTPLPALLRSSELGPDLNAAVHPLCGLLSSMHTWGLFHGRYGLSDRIFIDKIAPEHRPAVDAMLAGQLERQARLRAQLAADPATAPWAEDGALLHNYKLLQFFDTLALYFNCTAAADRAVATFAHVPLQPGCDTTITVRPRRPGVYEVAPYPFSRSPLTITCAGRWLRPVAPDADVQAALREAPGDLETITLCAPEPS